MLKGRRVQQLKMRRYILKNRARACNSTKMKQKNELENAKNELQRLNQEIADNYAQAT